jgi:hypothetical protein
LKDGTKEDVQCLKAEPIIYARKQNLKLADAILESLALSRIKKAAEKNAFVDLGNNDFYEVSFVNFDID